MGKIASGLAVLIGGLFLGSIAAIYHSALFPLGLIACVTIVGAFLLSLRSIAESRVFAAIGALGSFSSILLLAGLDGSSSVIIMADLGGFLFLGVSAALAGIILAWPRLSPSKTGYDEGASVSERNSLS